MTKKLDPRWLARLAALGVPELPPAPPDDPLPPDEVARLRKLALKRLHDQWDPRQAPEELFYDDAERDCRACKTPTHWRTQRGSPLHPMCERRGWALTPAAEAKVVFAVALLTRGYVISTPEPPRPWNLRLRIGPCSWCQAPGFGITADRYFHCRNHMHKPYIWTE